MTHTTKNNPGGTDIYRNGQYLSAETICRLLDTLDRCVDSMEAFDKAGSDARASWDFSQERYAAYENLEATP